MMREIKMRMESLHQFYTLRVQNEEIRVQNTDPWLQVEGLSEELGEAKETMHQKADEQRYVCARVSIHSA
jgi:hypothetical protein